MRGASIEAFCDLAEMHPDPVTLHLFDDRRLIYANRRTRELAGCRAEKEGGIDPVDFAVGEAPEVFRQRLDAMLTRVLDEPLSVRWRAQAADGRERSWCSRIVALELGGTRYLMSVSREVGERCASADGSPTESSAEAERLGELGMLAFGVMHDLNNHLTAILNCSSLIASRRDISPRLKRELETIRCAAEDAASLPRQLMLLSREGRGAAREVRDVSAVISERSGVLRALLPAGTRLSVLAGREACLVLCDSSRIGEAIANLVRNAGEAIASGGRVEVGVRRLRLGSGGPLGPGGPPVSGRFVCIWVQDDGPGVPEENHDRIFDPFRTTKPPGRGAGMGLAVVDRIVRDHGGWVSLRDSPLGGALFELFLPEADDQAGSPRW
ncbi:MAG: ATP-binding protein [Polyangia bacterium]